MARSYDDWKTTEAPEEPYPVKCGLCGLVYPADSSLEEELHWHDFACQRRVDIRDQLDALGYGVV